ncbi:type I 3-dehydroquinate dehydratase [Brevibacterium atlanticum]|uniref:type I 3-dehydroquinate dehydratase n=1 Tax=Brevibacterium atlanticum TaxID=2697563 RepID=UPI00141EC080|nr:type I 3-dehydroquinate dehydratase [Brevibacterium atlanticum]
MLPLPFLNPAAGTPAVRNPLRPSVIVPTQAVDADELSSDCAEAARTSVVDVVEWRIDPLLAGSDGDGAERAEAVLTLLPSAVTAGLPVLVTLRTGFEGGAVDIAEDEYAEVARRLVAGLSGAGSVPVALDIEIDRAEAGALIAEAREVGVPVVASHHNFESTDSREDLIATFRRMAASGADVAKAAMMPQTPADVARLLGATAEAHAELGCPVLGISMGRLGRTSRIMGADFGSCATFAQIGQASAPGQIDAAHLAEILDRL